MAKPIKETPVLTGKDAERFNRIMKENETKKVSASDYQRAQDAFRSFSFKD